MAELFVVSKLAESVVSQAVDRISDLLFQEAASLAGVRGDVERLQTELRRMQCFLKDADRKQDHDERVRNWIAEVSDVACDAEDVVETFVARVCSSSHVKKLFHAGKLRREIGSVRAKIDDILKSTQTYRIDFAGGDGTTSSVAKLQRTLRRTYPDDDDGAGDDVISLEDSEEALKRELMKVEEDRLCAVAAVGMGGLGKTTLAKKVFNCGEVKRHFDCCAWVYMSQQYAVEDVLYQVLVQLERDIEETEDFRALREHELVEKLRKKLKEKRYLVVIDDIWEIKAWDGIKSAFPKGARGSKVVFTTRNKEVALFADPNSYLIEPPFLAFEESWELLRRKALRGGGFSEHNIPPEIEKLGKDMVRKCGGLPLAVVVLGGLLRTRDSICEWEEVQRDLNAYLNKLHSAQSYEGVNGILALSYDDLPYYLKPCFLYLGIYPEDREISKRKLIHKWIAQGLIAQTMRQSRDQGKETLEDVAEHYLGELMDRYMIQVGRRNESQFGVKTYRMHDLMRDLCLSKAREEKFLEIVQDHHTATPPICSRRIAVHANSSHLDMYHIKPRIRSLVYFDQPNFPSTRYLRRESFILLRELELPFLVIGPKKFKPISDLTHLRYLGLKLRGYQEIMHIPDSIGSLRSLLTLCIECSKLQCILPRGISKLTRLTHLLIKDLALNYGRKIAYNPWVPQIRFDALVKLTNLQRLKLRIQSEEEARALLESPVIRSGCLRSLSLYLVSLEDAAFPNLRSLSRCPSLCKLRLLGKLGGASCHDSLRSLPSSLVKLTLKKSFIKDDPMLVLEKLPNLRHLRMLDDSYCGSEMVCSALGFPKLETLQIYALHSLTRWRVEKDAMPSLRRLLVGELRLSMIPEGLQFISTLRQLDISVMDVAFGDRVRVDKHGTEGQDFDKVRHIPSITVRNELPFISHLPRP